MPAFWYSTERSGERRYIEAENLPQALLGLREEGVTVTAVGAVGEPERDWPGIPWRTLIAVYEQMAAVVEQGAPLDRGLRAIAAESPDTRIAASLRALAGDLEDGQSLAEAMARQPNVYPPDTVAVVGAGEAAADLPSALRALAESQRAVAQIARGMAFPLVYPVIISILGLGIFGFIAMFILPKFLQLFLDLGMESRDFPVPTRLVMAVFTHVGPVLLVVGVLAVVAWLFWQWLRRTERGRFNLGLIRLRVPIFGEVSIYTDLARVAGTLSLLLQGGVDTVQALRLARGAAQEPAVALALRRAGLVVSEGGTIAEALRDTELLPEEFVFRLGVAEADGTLPRVLRIIAAEYVSYADRLAEKWIVISGPIVVIILAVLVGFTGISMFLPLIGVIQSLSQ